MLRPYALRSGARVAVVSPASPFPEQELVQGLDELRALGFEPAVDARTYQRHRYVSGSASTRAAVLLEALNDPTVDAIIGARGGYGSVHILELLDPVAVRMARKPIIGYSDLTSLLQFVAVQCGLVAFHGPTVAGRLGAGTAKYDRDSFLRLLTVADPMGELRAPGVEVMRQGEAAGPLFGGTLTQLCASMGTPFAFVPPRDFVLLIEEVNERPYRLDRMMTQLRLAGVLQRAAAIVFGELPGCDEPSGTPTARDVLADLCADFRGPVLWGFPTGHASGPTWTVPLGVRVRVVAQPPDPMLVVEEPAVDRR